MLKIWMQNLYMQAHRQCSAHTLDLLPRESGARLLDLGCYDGAWTKTLAERIGTADVHGVEILKEPAAAARAKGIQVAPADLEAKWPYPDSHFDIVHSSFVIEHMNSIDHFVGETYRVLKPGGCAITTTENGSSWHNIFAAVMGWQTFSSACCSTRVRGLGNPLALHRGPGETVPSMTHKVIFNYLGFREIFTAHGFQALRLRGAGYHPLPARLGDWDRRHAHFLVLAARKPGVEMP